MPVKRAEWIAEIRFHGKEERMETTLLRLFLRAAVYIVLSIFVEKKTAFCAFETTFVFHCCSWFSQKKKKRKEKKKNPSSKIVLADFKKIHFLTNLS